MSCSAQEADARRWRPLRGLADHRLMSEPALSPDALLGTVRYWADELEPARALLLRRARAIGGGR